MCMNYIWPPKTPTYPDKHPSSPDQPDIYARFHKTVLNEFYRLAFWKKIYRTLERLQIDLDGWLQEYNDRRSHGEGENVSGVTR